MQTSTPHPLPHPHRVWATDGDPSEPAETGLARLAAAVGPLRRALAAVAERMIATKGYERLCYARLGDYARERPGLSARQMQELARVHRALAGLPALERSLVRNELVWSKVRLVARVASAEDEDAWIARARDLPTRRLEQEVRDRPGGLDPAEDAEEAESLTRVTVRCTPAVREKWTIAREFAERVAGQRLCDADALELATAEVFSAIAIDPAFTDRADEAPAQWRSEDEGASQEQPALAPRAPARELLQVASLAAALEEADAFELDRRLCLAVRLEQTLDAAIAPLLRVVTCSEYEWDFDYCTLPTFAQDQLGMSASKARALLRLERAGDVCPELRDAYRSGRLSWVKAQCLLPLLLLDLDGEWRPAWVAWAARVTVRRLAQDVERALLLRAGHDRAWYRCKFHPERAQDPIPPEERQLCAPDIDTEATQELTWRVPRDVAVLFHAVLETLRSRLRSERGRWLTDGEVFDALLDGALLAWTLRRPGARRPDPVMERDGYRCLVPGCSSRRSLHDHHIIFRSACGPDAAWNRGVLCAFHHQRCLHAGRMRLRGGAPDGLVFELGVRPGAAPLVCYRFGDIVIPRTQVRPITRPRRAA